MGRHYRINNMWNQNNDTTMNVPGDNVVTDVIPPGGGDLNTKEMDLQCYHLILHYVKKHYYINNIWRKKGLKVQDWKISIKRLLPMSLS